MSENIKQIAIKNGATNMFENKNIGVDIENVDVDENTNLKVKLEEMEQAIGNAGNVPKNHQSSTTEYGAATADYYGHVKLSDNYESANSDVGANSGIGASIYAVKLLEQNLKNNSVPVNHASQYSTYGLGNSTYYGHTQVSDNYFNAPNVNYNAANGVAASLYAAQQLNNSVTGLQTNVNNLTNLVNNMSTSTNGKAPTNHASTNKTLYGLGSSNYYGHLRISDDLIGNYSLGTNGLSNHYYNGIAASLYTVQKLYDDVTSLSNDVEILKNEGFVLIGTLRYELKKKNLGMPTSIMSIHNSGTISNESFNLITSNFTDEKLGTSVSARNIFPSNQDKAYYCKIIDSYNTNTTLIVYNGVNSTTYYGVKDLIYENKSNSIAKANSSISESELLTTLNYGKLRTMASNLDNLASLQQTNTNYIAQTIYNPNIMTDSSVPSAEHVYPGVVYLYEKWRFID